MALADDNFEELKKRVFDAYKNEDPVIEKFRAYARQLKNDVKQIRSYSVNAVSFVSADGGDNRLFFNPATVELVRVVDSRGNQCALDAIAGNSKSSDFNERANSRSPLLVEPLRKLCEDLKLSVLDLSYLLKGIDEPGKSTGAIRTYRDIVEWAVLYDLIKYREWGSDTIIIREVIISVIVTHLFRSIVTHPSGFLFRSKVTHLFRSKGTHPFWDWDLMVQMY